MGRLIVPRTVTVVDGERSGSAPLTEFRSERAYVLLGDPGAGKTEAFDAECEEHINGEVVPARRFLRKSVDRMSEWDGKTLFLDGLDEVRAGSGDPRRPLDQILERLERLGRPTFRLSCRAADWLGRNDLREIVSGAGYEDVCVLYLEPLTHKDVHEILIDLGEPDADAFRAKARDRGLEELFDNPLSLDLLVRATRGDGWPRGLRETYELACRSLTQSQCRQPSEVNRTLAAAGHLSALLLLSEKESLATDQTDDPDTLCLQDIEDGDPPARLGALHSNLFTRRAGSRFVSKHQHLAAFLAARFLHRCIKQDVPVGRVLSLMSGQDGVVVTELRGLSAWLAAFNRSARESLMSTDPVGIALYGDVGGFRKEELRRLLRVLADRADEIRPWNWPPVALASLINGHSVALLTRYLEDDDRSRARRTVVGLLLHALSLVDRIRPCPKSLLRTIRDATWDRWVRKSALRTLLHHTEDENGAPLNGLLGDLRDGRVEDRDGYLLGTLLNHLYPRHLGPGRIWDYLVPRGQPDNCSGTYHAFWSTHFPDMTKGEDLFALLRSRRERGNAFRKQHGDEWLRRILQKLVRRALDTAGDTQTASTLYDWLELIGFEGAEWFKVAQWLARRPELQKELALEGLSRRFGAGDSAPCADHGGPDDQDGDGHAGVNDAAYREMQIWPTVFSEGKPDDFSAWSLSQAVAAAETNPEMARILLDWSRPWGQDDSGSGLSIEEVRAATRDVPGLRDEVANLLDDQRRWEAHEAEMRVREQVNEYRLEHRRNKQEFITYVRKHAVELQKGRCPPALLHRIAVAYHDFYNDQREATPRQRVLKRLQEHQDLANAAIEGFCRVLDRDDLPTLREVIRLGEQKQMSYYALPVLAGFDSSPDLLESRRPAEIARAAAFYYLTPLNVPGHPEWYRWALEHRPEPIAEALLKVTRSRVRKRRDCLYLWDFARNASYRDVAHLAAVPLLRAFPTRCTEPQISALHAVVLAALRWRVDGLGAFVEARVSKPDLDVSQRALWLTAGLHLSPERYLERIAAFLEDGEEARSQQVVRLLAPTEMKRLPMPWDTRELATMIKLLGGRYAPWRPEGFGMASVVDEDRWKVEGLISAWATTLASRTSRQAFEALHSLVEDPALEPWHYMLKGKRDEQSVARRDATFAVPDLRAVQQTLADAEPCNAADLAALVSDRLEHLGKEIRHGNTDDWRQYWNEDEHGRPTQPKREESCCKALLSALKGHLPNGVDAQRESVHSRDKRSDIRVSFNGHAIPVEIKKDSNRRLWSAIADQLIPRYTTAPESSGFGIYLVLWFGQGKVPPPPTGRRPRTPEELCARLRQQLTGPYRHKISVLVIDVSTDVQPTASTTLPPPPTPSPPDPPTALRSA